MGQAGACRCIPRSISSGLQALVIRLPQAARRATKLRGLARPLATGIAAPERSSDPVECRHVVRRSTLGRIGTGQTDDLGTVGLRRNAHPVAPIHHWVGRRQALDNRLEIGVCTAARGFQQSCRTTPQARPRLPPSQYRAPSSEQGPPARPIVGYPVASSVDLLFPALHGRPPLQHDRSSLCSSMWWLTTGVGAPISSRGQICSLFSCLLCGEGGGHQNV